MNTKQLYPLLRDLNEKINARQSDVRLLLSRSGIKLSEGSEISFLDIKKAIDTDVDFTYSLYNLLYGKTANADGSADWMDWASGISSGLSSLFGTITAAKSDKSAASSNAELLEEIKKMNESNTGTDTDTGSSKTIYWVIGGVALALVIGIIIVVIVKKKK